MSLPDPALLPGPLGPPATMQVPKFDNTLGALLVGGLVAMAFVFHWLSTRNAIYRLAGCGV